MKQILGLVKKHDFKNAALLTKMVTQSRAVWLTGGTPAEVRKQVKQTMLFASLQRATPVFVAYNVPYRDCAQYSAGGALSTADYKAWIDGVAAGIGSGKAWVILEPDGLGLIPYNTRLDGNEEWCKPQVNGNPAPEADPAHRYEQLNYAVDKLEALSGVSVYLDGTHANWLGIGDTAWRLVNAGVNRAAGFFLNVSNYQFTANSVAYGTWVSDCIAYATSVSPGDFSGCPNQYWNGGPATNWKGTQLNPFGQWSEALDPLEFSTAGLNSRYALMMGSTVAATHFVVDTSRNGLGPWDYRSDYPDAGTAQDWCNAPGRGLGIRSTTNTGNALVDAYLWVKAPAESDGQCTRGTAGPTDPEWGMTDPAAGAWFPEQALQLAQLANPPLL
jgi:endoglucanase